jgi:hypothetical protein
MNRLLATGCFVTGIAAAVVAAAEVIDRRTLVERHDVRLEGDLPSSPLSVGNGEFAFTFDATGMQTFGTDRGRAVPLSTMADWAWHSFLESKQYDYNQTLRDFQVHGRTVSYATDMKSAAAQALRANPHRFSLGRVALRLIDDRGKRLTTAAELETPTQRLSLWSGEAVSEFRFAGQSVRVRTVAHPVLDAVAVAIESPLIASGRASIELSFAYPAGEWGPKVDDWDSIQRHDTQLTGQGGGVRLLRTLDETSYAADVVTNGTVRADSRPHAFVVEPTSESAPTLHCAVHFVRDPANQPAELDFDVVRKAAREHWPRFWTIGGAIDLSGSRDPRWRELERRIVLSQYLTAIHCAGSMPPQETGLVCNSWFGKSHLEMHWWHAAHFELWGRGELLEKSLDWYLKILPAARRIAERQGYAGVRWPKMTGPHGVSSPSEVGELLIWQQPHPIYFAELAYRSHPTRETLERYWRLVEPTADFMASYAHYESARDRYVLGPVLIPAQECYDGRSAPGVLNPTFELAYWRWALRVANQWRNRLRIPAEPKWEEVAEKIANPTVRAGIYAAIETFPFTRRRDHPSMLAAFGVLPDVGMIERRAMSRTLDSVVRDWDWADTWGWDYPMMAMTAARLGNGKQAVDLLLMNSPKNDYLPNGHCRQSDRLPLYLPANGGLLTAAAMMAAGWDGADAAQHAPGFPRDGSWKVRFEGIVRLP